MTITTYWNSDTSGSTKSSLANVRVCFKARFTVQARTQEQSGIKGNDSKNEQNGKSNPSTFFSSIRGWKDSYSTKNIYACKIENKIKVYTNWWLLLHCLVVKYVMSIHKCTCSQINISWVFTYRLFLIMLKEQEQAKVQLLTIKHSLSVRAVSRRNFMTDLGFFLKQRRPSRKGRKQSVRAAFVWRLIFYCLYQRFCNRRKSFRSVPPC
jgi:hypothetical protein